MRLKFLAAAGLALALAACGSSDRTDNTLNVGENLYSDSEMSNDVTAIDAVTGADANMAADVNYVNAVGNGAAANTTAPAKPGAKAATSNTAAPAKPPAQTPAPATATPATNNTAQ